MFLIYCGLVALLSCCGLRYVDCQPSFTVIPNNGNPIYVTEGAGPLTLAWDYNADGRTVDKVFLVYMNGVHEVVVAGKAPSGSLQIQSGVGYDGRVTFRGRATFEISSIVPSDSRIFKCRVTFETFQPPEISRSNVEVVVVVPPTITLKSPTSVELDEGSSTTLLCFATGNPKPTYKWEKGSIIVQENADSNYTIASANKDHTGRYTCTATVTAPGVQHPVGYFVDVKVRYKPQVSSLTGNRTLDDGSNAEFFCKAVAYPTAITYNWFKDGSAITHDPSRKIFVNIVGSQSRLRVEQIKKDSAGRYSCSGTNALGTGEQEAVFLKVNYAPQNVTVKPERAEVKEGQSTTLTCHSDGYPTPGFSWKFNGNVLNGATQNTFMLTNVEVKDAGNYTCVANNDRGSKETTRVVNVLYKPTITTLTTGTPNNNVVQGTTVVISCSANGYPVPSYTIKRNGTDVTQNAGAGKHRITDIQLSAEYDSYSCVPRNSEGDGPRKVLKITVQVPPRFFAQTLPTTRQVEKENTSVSYSCVAKAKPAAKIQWVLNGKNLTNSPPYNILESFQTIQGSKLFKTFSYLDIARLTWRQYGNFSCLAYNEAGGQVRQNTELEVRYKPEMVRLLASKGTVCRDAVVSFICLANGNPTVFTYQLYENDVMAANGSSSGIWIRTMSTGGAFSYTCAASNIIGTANSRSVSVTVNVPSSIQPIHDEVQIEGGNVTLFCNASGIPSPSVHWIKVSGGQRFSANVLVLTNISRSEAGEYRCEASNRCGSDLESVTIDVQYKPERTQLFAIDATVCRGTNIIFNCSADGNPSALIYQLYEDDIAVNNVISSGVWSRKMSSKGVFNYRCVANNTIGTATSANVTVTVNAPASVEPLKNKIVNKGDSFKFFCKVSGKLATSVFWTQVSTGLKHHNETWVITDIDVSDLGEYRCDATNMCGNDSDSMTIFFEGGKCEAKCTDGKNCRLFGVYLCLCDKGKTGTNCTETEELTRTVVVGFEFRNEEFKPQYENLEDIETLMFIEKVIKACIEEFEGSGLTEAKVAKLRKGSVIADVEMTFKDTVGESEIAALMKEATKDGKLGKIEVSQVEEVRAVNGFSTSAPSEQAKVNKGVIYGPIIAVLALMFISFIVYFIIKQRRHKRTDRQEEKPGGIQESHHNLGFETERNDTDNANVPVPIPYMELSEVTDSQGRPEGAEATETSPYLEINEYAPLHPATRSLREVSRETVVIEKVIGQGAFGQVAQGKASELQGREETHQHEGL